MLRNIIDSGIPTCLKKLSLLADQMFQSVWGATTPFPEISRENFFFQSATFSVIAIFHPMAISIKSN